MLVPATLAALPSTRAIPDGDVFYVADPVNSIETRSLPTLTRSYPRRFTFYLAHPIRSVRGSVAPARRRVVNRRTFFCRLNLVSAACTSGTMST